MKRFNYTGRKKVLQEDIHARIHANPDGPLAFDIVMEISDYGFPVDSDIYVEAYRQTRWMRHLLGKTGSFNNTTGLSLTDFDDPDGIRFRVKIVEPSSGILLGIADRVTPFTEGVDVDGNQISILPVVSADLSRDGVLWKIEFDSDDARLLYENELGGKEQVVRSQIFKALILPSAMREILNRIIYTENYSDDGFEEMGNWQSRWLYFVKALGGGNRPLEDSSDEEKDNWIEEALRLLARKIGCRAAFIEDFERKLW